MLPIDVARIGLYAALALLAVYAYAVAALWTHARLATLAAPRSLTRALLAGALVPACGCTALPYARRAPPRLRAPFLVAAYGVNPLLVLAAALVAGWRGALVVLALGLAAAAAGRLLPAGERPRARLDDLLLRKDAAPLRDATPYMLAFAAPAVGIGAAFALAPLAPSVLAALAVGGLAVLFRPPHADVAQDHGPRLAGGIRALHVGFAVTLTPALALVG